MEVEEFFDRKNPLEEIAEQRAIGKLKATGYRRLWIVKESKPIGVFALTDLFKFIVNANGKKDDDKDKK